MNKQEGALVLMEIWGFVGMYYLLNIWFKPSILVMGIGFSIGVIFMTLINYAKDGESELGGSNA